MSQKIFQAYSLNLSQIGKDKNIRVNHFFLQSFDWLATKDIPSICVYCE